MTKESFLKLNKKNFVQMLKTEAKLGTALGAKLLTATKKRLKNVAFFTEMNNNNIDRDYYHILKSHINEGDKISTINLFEFFRIAVHYDDPQTDLETQCISFKRAGQMRTQSDKKIVEEKKDNQLKTVDIWKLKQCYIGNRLDIIHSYLVHSRSHRFVQKYSNCADNKYISDVSTNEYINDDQYGFGVDFSHPHLSPQYCSVADELLHNQQCSIDKKRFDLMLVKAINQQQIAQTAEDPLICKYFDKKYNILRNEHIGIRHVLSLVIYTDLSAFCTIFRKTYRSINADETVQEIAKRHIEFYYYARNLWEAIEFFGEYMDENLNVYHGLKTKMLFRKFRTHFNQPISTTTSLKAANEFSNSGGVILSLKSGAKYYNKLKQKPKFLSVSWLSDYPGEKELLFYGAAFEINNIIEVKRNMTKHTTELKIFNTFQKLIENQTIDWTDKQHMMHMEALSTLIICQQHKENKSKNNITTYGQQLFHHFCKYVSQVCIKNFESLPAELRKALFNDCGNVKQYQLSLIPFIKLFPNLRELIFNELDLQQMTSKFSSGEFVHVVLKTIKYANDSHNEKLEKIEFKSEQKTYHKENAALKDAINKCFDNISEYGWESKYQYQTENMDILIFINKNNYFKSNIRKSSNSNSTSPISDIYQSQPNQPLLYFMQITNIDEDEFHVVITLNKPCNKKQKLYVKELNQSYNETQKKQIVFRANEIKTEIDLDIEEDHDTLYHLALYENKKATIPLANSNQLCFDVIKNEEEFVTPECIDISTVIKCKDKLNGLLKIYWSVPSKCYGEISYYIVKTSNKEQQKITLLPYSIPLSGLP
eukprot:117284_1